MANAIQAKKASIEANERKIAELERLTEAREESLRAPPSQDPALAAKEHDENRKAIASYKTEIDELTRVNEVLKREVRDLE